MNTREQLIKNLNFNRFNIHTVGEKIGGDIEQAQVEIDNNQSLSPDELKTLCKQVALYYLFYLRDKDIALKYLNKFQTLVPEGSLDHAEACNLIGHAHTIDGSYKDDTLFNKALDIYAVSDKTMEVQLARAFAFRYIGFMHHRKKETQKALENIELAITIQRSFQDTFPPVKLDIAESLHAKGVILIREGKLEEAEQQLLQAKKLEEEFCEATQHKHFLKFITMQSLGSVWLRQNKTMEALAILQKAYEEQTILCKTTVHADIAKTLHFMGDVYMQMGIYDQAVCAYQQSLDIKQTLKLDKDMVNVTENALRKAKLAEKNKDFDFDWNNYHTIQPNAEKIQDLEKFIEDTLPNKDKLDDQAKQEFGELCYKLGTFYNHIYIKREPDRAPDLALQKLAIAKELLKSDEALGWVDNHIAFSYQQKLSAAKKKNNQEEVYENRELARKHYGKVIDDFNNNEGPINHAHAKLFSFAFCVRALTEYELNELRSALFSYQIALDTYEKINELDDQYARAKNAKARIHVDNNELDLAAILFKELEAYWYGAHYDSSNPYLARFEYTYAEFLAKAYPKNLSLALTHYQKAYEISCISDGDKAGFTIAIQTKIDELKQKQQELAQKGNVVYSPTMYTQARDFKEKEDKPKSQIINYQYK